MSNRAFDGCLIANAITQEGWQYLTRSGLSARTVWCIALAGVAICTQARTSAAQVPPAEATIAYRLVEPKTMHFEDPQKYAAHAEQVQKLGCEVAKNEHAGHGDLTYRCPKWKALTVANDELAHQWEEWFESSGFETLHGHAEDHEAGHEDAHAHEHEHGEGEHEEVTYRLANWVTLNPQQPIDADELVAIAKGLGCEVQESRQPGALSISIRCTDQKHIECPSHEAAQFWQQWLTKTGFEAQHED